MLKNKFDHLRKIDNPLKWKFSLISENLFKFISEKAKKITHEHFIRSEPYDVLTICGSE